MRFTTKDLRQPNETLADKVETVTLTRGDVIFLNTVIGIANKVLDNPDFQRENMTIGMLFATDELRPGTLNLVKKSPSLFQRHVEQYAIEMATKQESYYKDHPEKRPAPVESVDPRLVPVGEDPVSSHFSDDTGQSVDAEAQQPEQTKVEQNGV